MNNFGKFVGLLVVVDSLGTAGYLMCNKYIFAGKGSLASAAALGVLMCLIFMALGVVFGLSERRRTLSLGKEYLLIPKGRWGGFLTWALLGVAGDVCFVLAITFHMSLGFGGILNRGVIILIVNVGAWRMFRQRLNRLQWLGVGVGLAASIGTLLVAFAEQGNLFTGKAELWLGIPLWVIFTVSGAFFFGTKDLLTRRLLTEVPVGTSVFWANLIGLPICALLLGAAHLWLPVELCSYPESFVAGVLIACSFLLFAVPCRHTAKRRELNPALHSELRAGIVLLFSFAFDICYHAADFSDAAHGSYKFLAMSAVIVSSMVSLLLLCLGGLSDQRRLVKSSA